MLASCVVIVTFGLNIPKKAKDGGHLVFLQEEPKYNKQPGLKECFVFKAKQTVTLMKEGIVVNYKPHRQNHEQSE